MASIDLRAAAQQALEALQNCANGEDDVLLTRDALANLRAALAEPDLFHCPKCGGPADNGHDRSIPPSPYWCTKCMAEPVQEPDNKAASIRWQLCLLAQTEEFSDDVRNQIGRGVWLIDRLRAALAEPVLQTCNCRWNGEVQVQQCTLHEAHVDAIHEWAERAKTAEKKLAALAEPVQDHLPDITKMVQEPGVWTPVTDALPQSGVKVLACYRNRLGNLRRIRAMWTAAKTEEASSEDAEACSEYDEATDTYYVTEGWYECIDNWGDYSSVAVTEGEVTHWMPLPPDPDSAPPQRKPLTEEEIEMEWSLTPQDEKREGVYFARRIERAHGIGGQDESACAPVQPRGAMNKDEIIRMAREAGLKVATNISGVTLVGAPLGDTPSIGHITIDEMARFTALVVAAERERNAKIADAHASCEGIGQVIAAEIRGQA